MPAASWIAHVKETHKKNGGSYKDALKAASKTWKKGGAAAAPKKRRGKKAAEEPVEEDEKAEEAPKKRRRKKQKKKPVESVVPKKRGRGQGNRPAPPKHFKNIN